MNDRAPPAEVIRRAIDRIRELDNEMSEIDERMTRYQELIDDPDADGWDRIDAEGKAVPLAAQRDVLRGQLLQAVGEITSAGRVLIDAWRENLIDDVGKELRQDGPIARVFEEFPGIETQAVWQRLEAASCPF